MAKTRLNISMDQDLADFVKIFAAENRTTVADILTQYLLSLKRRVDGETTEKILAHPAFHDAMKDVQKRLQDGRAVWRAYDEAFED